jgi:hypothetical protein
MDERQIQPLASVGLLRLTISRGMVALAEGCVPAE